MAGGILGFIAENKRREEEERQKYAVEQQKLAIADEVVKQLSKTPDPSDLTGKKMIATPDFINRFNHAKAEHRAGLAEGLMKRVDIQQGLEALAFKRTQAERDYSLNVRQFNQNLESGKKENLELTPEERKSAEAVGVVPLRTGRGSFDYAAKPGLNIDMDAAGNPVFSPDESMYREGGKWKPITDAMRKAREDWTEKQKALNKPPEEQQESWWSSAWNKIKASKAPPPPAAQAPPAPTGKAPVSAGIRALAEKALKDPNASEAHKARARQILGL